MNPLLVALLAIAFLVILISWLKVNAFLAFLLTSLTSGLVMGIPVSKITGSMEKGLGDTLGQLLIIIALGAMLGKIVAESGAALRISSTLTGLIGTKYIQWAMVATGFIVGIPLFYNVGFVLMVPIIFSVVSVYKLPAVYIGLPMLAALSVTHGFLPPHPSPVALVKIFHADLGKTLLFGIMLAVPAIIIAGPLFSQTLKKIESKPLLTFAARDVPTNEQPGTAASFLSALLPVILLAGFALLRGLLPSSPLVAALYGIFGNATLVMLFSICAATWSLGIAQGRSIKTVMGYYGEAIKDVSLILLVIAGAGCFKQVLTDSGVSAELGHVLGGWHIHPLVLGWLIASMIRVCIGSATIAGLTAAGIIAPLVIHTGVNPSLMVLAIGAGSLMFSHVNDPGFWMFKEYFNLSMGDTLRSWSLMETLVAFTGLGGVMLLNNIVA